MDTDRNRLITSNELNISSPSEQLQTAKSKKKKYIIIGVAVTVVVIIAIVLGVTLGKKSDPVNPNPPEPNNPSYYNSY